MDPAGREVLIETGINDPMAIQLVISLLEEAGVPYRTETGREAVWSPVQDFRGWFRLYVPASHEKAAREIVGSVLTPGPQDLDVLIETGLRDPIAIDLAKSLLQQAGVPFFAMDANPAARQESGNILGWWRIRVPAACEADAREILGSLNAENGP